MQTIPSCWPCVGITRRAYADRHEQSLTIRVDLTMHSCDVNKGPAAAAAHGQCWLVTLSRDAGHWVR